MDLKDILAMNLRFYRHKLNLTQKEFYEKYNLNFKYMSRVESAKVNVTIETVEKVADILEISPVELLTYDNKHKVNKKRVDSKA